MSIRPFPLVFFTSILVWLTGLFPLQGAEPGEVLLSDTFADGDAGNPALPASAAWFYSGRAAGKLKVEDTGGLRWDTAPNSLLIGHFAPRSIPDGRELVLTVDFTLEGPVAAIRNGLRIGLLSSNGAPITAGGYTVVSTLFQGYSGYGVYTDAGLAAEREAILFRRDAGTLPTSSNLMGAGYPASIGQAGPGANLAAGTPYTATLSVRNDGGTTRIGFSLNGATLSALDPAGYTAFDTVAFQAIQGMVTAITFKKIEVKLVAASAPAKGATVSVGPGLHLALVGDSTLADAGPALPQRGWGQALPALLPAGVKVTNEAQGGTSTKTYPAARWRRVLNAKPDFVFIQFGHNDSHAKGQPESTDAATDYRDNLRRLVREARAAGVTVVLVTPVRRRLYRDGRATTELGPYAEGTRIVAAELGVKLVDLYASSGRLFEQLGEDGSSVFTVNKRDDADRPGLDDRTHFTETGAREIAKLVAAEFPQIDPRLAPLVRPGTGG